MKYLLSLVLFSSLSFAGDKGNGGISLVCRNDKNEITTAELLDIYEGKVLAGKTYKNNGNIIEKLNFATRKIAHLPEFSKLLQEKIELVISNMFFVPHGNELLPTDDAFPVAKKKGCKFEQLANFTANNDLYISIEIYEKLDTLNIVALILHEAVYATRRIAGDQNSQISRKIVAELMAEDTNLDLVERLIPKLK